MFLLRAAQLLILSFALLEYASAQPSRVRRSGRCQGRPRPSSSSTGSAVLVASTQAATSTSHAVPTTSSAAHTSVSTSHAATSSAPAPTPTSSGGGSGGGSSGGASGLTPNGIKAGIAGGDSYNFMKDHIGWWYDWTPNPSKPGSPIAVPMLWGGGGADSQDASRLSQFRSITNAPKYVLGYEEPDCPSGSGSAGMSVSDGVSLWEQLIAPLGSKGTLLGSPSMCKQADETWLKSFKSQVSTQWDFTAIHVNKNSLDGIKKDVDYYWNTYNKPIWVTEFACVDDQNGFTPCTDQGEINSFINTAVDYFQQDSRVFAYGYSNGLGLGNVWPLMRGSSLSESGQTYLAAISKYH